ncbi:MAG: alanine racemase [Rhodothermaceae bacterium]|nr:alanine racemase [Rhodothermaceae bacterium]
MFDPMHGSYIEISKSAYRENLKYLRSRFGGVSISSVIKGNAYGHGVDEIIPIAESCGIKHFSVFSADEALASRKAIRNGSTIMIMGDVDGDALEWAVDNDISFYIFEPQRLERALQAARRTGKKAKIHLELETGMHRTGLAGKELTACLNLIGKHPDLVVLKGLCTHYAGAESVSNYLRVQNQIKSFNQKSVELKRKGLRPEILHTACSAAALSYPETRMDMVRIGIAQYGLWPSRETMMKVFTRDRKNTDPLNRVISWKSRVMSVKKVRTNEFIGYGNAYLTDAPIKVASVPVGYSHGFSRNLSNLGRVLINGKRTSVVGIVNMNMMLIDVTSCRDVKKGDEVVLIGSQGRYSVTISSFSELTNNLNYETLVRLPRNIPRIVVE